MNQTTLKGKVVFVGDSNVGKTALINKYNGNPPPTKETVGANSIKCLVKIYKERNSTTTNNNNNIKSNNNNDNNNLSENEKETGNVEQTVTLDVWDTAGQENYRCLLPMFARGAQAGVVVFNINCRQSFEHLDEWIQYLNDNDSNNGGVDGNEGCPIIIVANKYDLDHVVSNDEIQEYVHSKKCEFYQTSALTGDGVDLLFQAIAVLVDKRENTKMKATTVEIKEAPQSVVDGDTGSCC